MNTPFKIFPSVGYKNSQFQIVAQLNNLTIQFLLNGNIEKEVVVHADNPAVISKLEKPGSYVVVCSIDGVEYYQPIEVKDAIRLGSSELKAAYIFDGIDYTFLLMKDRLLLFNEKTNVVLTENEISPTDIKKVDEKHVLFLTQVGNSFNSICNFGVFNIDSLSITSELLSRYRFITHDDSENKIWVYDVVSREVICFEINNGAFHLTFTLSNIVEYRFIENNHLFVETDEEIKLINVKNQGISTTKKSDSIAIDLEGFLYTLNDNTIHIKGIIHPLNMLLSKAVETLIFNRERFCFMGSKFTFNPIQITEPVLPDDENFIEEMFVSVDVANASQYCPLPKDKLITTTCTTHEVYPTSGGVFYVSRTTTRTIEQVRFIKESPEKWRHEPYITTSQKCSVNYQTPGSEKQLTIPSNNLSMLSYKYLTLIVSDKTVEYVLRGQQQKRVFPLNSDYKFVCKPGSNHTYLITKANSLHSVYKLDTLTQSLLSGITIHNIHFVDYHATIWYSKGGINTVNDIHVLNGYSLVTDSSIELNKIEAQHSIYETNYSFGFNKGYILSSNQILIHPDNGTIRDAAFNSILTFSTTLDKVIARRNEHVYFLNYDSGSSKYEAIEIEIPDVHYKESYLSPDGKFLVLKKQVNEYHWYDIENDEVTRFFSGNFLAFSKEGNLIIEENPARGAKLFDPKTSEDITPPNYHYYRFLSPDEKLYAQVPLLVKYYDKVQARFINSQEYVSLKTLLDMPSPYPYNEEVQLKKQLAERRERYYNANKTRLNDLGIYTASGATPYQIIEITKYVVIGIVGTNVVKELPMPLDVQFYNYASFSFDNKYFAYVGKPSCDGIFHLFKIVFDESSSTLSIKDSFDSRFPKRASWICGFSKKGHFATYDSIPDTYIIKAPEDFLSQKLSKDVLEEGIDRNRQSHQSYESIGVVPGKNFLCFSPGGNFIALSEQGYDPLTLGGSGHQESSAVHIAKVDTLDIINSFTGHGTAIKEDRDKKIIFVAFSEDEKKIMSMSADGVVVVRNLK